jgi:hypothetical protein
VAVVLAVGTPQVVVHAADSKAAAEADLTKFVGMAKDAQGLAKSGEFVKARDRVKELEKVWDDEEDTVRPLNADAWRQTDRKLDKTLDKLRDAKPDAKAVGESFDALIAALEGLRKA